MIVSREQHEASLAELAASIADPRAGILGPRSVAWRLGGDLGVFLGGARASFLQIAHPAVAFAVDQHSKTKTDVVGRFQRTFRNVFAMVFGELDEALAAARRVHAIHTRITGTFPVGVGQWPAGTPYHANDADSLRWVHATLIDTTLVVREIVDGGLSERDKDGYVTEMNRFAALFGIPNHMRAKSHAEHAAYFRSMLPQLAVAPCAREMGQFLIGRGARQPPLGRVTEALAAAMIPARLAEEFGLRSSPKLVKLGLAIARHPLRALPIEIPAHAEARRRLQGLAPRPFDAWVERQLFGLARQATGA